MNLLYPALRATSRTDGEWWAWTADHRTTWAGPHDMGTGSATRTAGGLQPLIGTAQQ